MVMMKAMVMIVVMMAMTDGDSFSSNDSDSDGNIGDNGDDIGGGDGIAVLMITAEWQ